MRRSLALITRVTLFLLVFTTLFFDFSVYAAKKDVQPDTTPRHKKELIVKYKNQNKETSVKANVKQKLKLGKLESKFKSKDKQIDVLEIGESDNLDQTIAELKKDPNVAFVQPNYLLSTTDTPQDDRFAEQWGLNNQGQNSGTSGVDVGAMEAWNASMGNRSVLVGVLDTGIDIDHPDLAESIFTNSLEVPGNGMDDDGNGYADDVHGYDFANADATVYDSSSGDKHGTHVAGIIAAQANEIGVRGVAPGVSIVPLKFMNGGSGYTSDAIEAIEYAKQLGVTILNASFGGPDSNPALKDALDQSAMLVVASAGNNGKDASKTPVYPGAFTLSNLISVASVDNRGQLASFSSYGGTIDVAAPGVDILSTIPGGEYGYLSGTSMSAPFVTGIAALLKSQYADMTNDQLLQRIVGSSRSSTGLIGKVASGGWVNAASAMNASLESTPESPDPTEEGNGGQEGDGMVVSLAAEISGALLEQVHYGEDGVNVATGNYSKTETDLSVTSPGFIVNMSRTYNSKDDRPSSSMGRGWTFGFEGSVKDDTTNTTLKVVKLPNGSAQVFVKNADGTYTANDSHSTLVKLSDNTHVLTTADQYTYGFNTTGYLTYMQDRNGNRVSITPDAQGKVTQITDTVSRIYQIGYVNGYLKTITDPIGRVITYGYDAQNRLSTVTDTNNRVVMKYTYDSSNYLNGVLDGADTLLESITYNHTAGVNQHKVEKTTNAYGNVFLYTYDNANRKTTIKDLPGLTIMKWYDTAGYVVKSQDPENRITTVEYYLDASGYNKFGEEKFITDRYGNKTQYERDANGNITKIINPDNSARNYQYDSKNNLIVEIDEVGNRTEYVYDTSKTKIKMKVQPLNGTDVYSADANQELFAITAYSHYTNSESTALGYKAKGLLKSEMDPEGNKTSYTYDAEGNKKTVTSAEGNTTTFTYNGVAWVTSQTSPTGFQSTYDYNKDGQLVRTVREGGETSFLVYDALGRLIQTVSPRVYNPAEDGLLDAAPTPTYKKATVGERIVYEPNGLVKSKTDVLGNVTQYTYDVYGNVSSEIKPNGAVYLYAYDAMNRLKATQFKPNAQAVPVTLSTTAYSVLSDGRTQKTDTVYLNDSETAITTHTYDVMGREYNVLQADGTTTAVTYYANGQLKSSHDARGNATQYRYDIFGNVTDQWSPLDGSKYRYNGSRYDKAGRKVKEMVGKDAMNLSVVPSADRVTTTTTKYTPDGHVVEVATSAGGMTRYEYDEEGRVVREDIATTADTALTTSYRYDHQAKPVEKIQHVRSGDLAGNEWNDDSETLLTSSFAYDADGNVVSQVAPDGVRTQYTYDLLGRLLITSTESQDEQGLPVEITSSSTFDWAGNVLTSTDPLGNVTAFAYDARGNLVKKTDAWNGITGYAYDRAGRKIIEVSPQNYDATKSFTQVSRTTYVYDKMNRVQLVKEAFTEKKLNPTTFAWIDSPTELVTQAFAYDANSNVVKQLTGEGYMAGTGATIEARIKSGYGVETTYNAANLPITTKDPVTAERGLKWTTKIQYDGSGRAISIIDANGAVSGTRYDEAGRIIATTIRASINAPERVLTSVQYDLAGRATGKKDGNGNETKITYNAWGQVASLIEPGDESIQSYTTSNQYDVFGRLVRTEDSEGVVRLTAYDPQGKVTEQTEQASDGSQSITTSSRYDKNGNVRFVTDGNGNVTEFLYDELNRMVETKVAVTNIDGVKSTQSTSMGYDRNGNKLWEQNWLGNRTNYMYDERNRLIQTQDATGAVIQKLLYNANDAQVASYDALNRVTTFAFDRNNRQISVTDPEGNVTKQTYNNVGLKSSDTDGEGHSTRYAYDEFGHLTTVTNALEEKTSYTYDLNGNRLTQKDGRGMITTFEYNAANKLVRKIDHGGRSGKPGSYVYAPSKVESYTYTASGQTKTKVDRNGHTTSYSYDVHNRILSQIVIGEGLESAANTISYTYDNNNNQLSIKDGTGITSRAYDELNRVISKTVPGMGTSTFLLDQTTGLNAGFHMEITTDVKGNITKKVYDKASRLVEVRNNNTPKATYTYYNDGSQQKVTYASGANEQYVYDNNNRLKKLENYQGTTLLDRYEYTYDGANNQLTKKELVGGVDKGTTQFFYDALSRLETVIEPSLKKTAYTYDASGNRLTEKVTSGSSSTLTTYTYNEQNRLLMTVQAQSFGETRIEKFSYDNNGNMLNKSVDSIKAVDPSNPPTPTFGIFIYGQENDNPRINDVVNGVAMYQYDGFNQLIKMGTGSSGATYAYNGDGLRVKKTVGTATTAFLYEYDQVVLETDGNGKQTARNLYGLNLVSRTMGSDTYYYLYNGHSDVTALLTAAGVVASSYEYDAFGNVTNQAGNVSNPIRYAGYQYDEESKLYYLNSRYYDPKLARFLTEDTYRGQANDTLSLNLYTYVHNNPIQYYDPTGHAAVTKGQKGDQVKAVQEMLQSAGYNITADGSFGAQTLAAVTDFQKKNGLTADGSVGNQTLSVLGAISTTKNAPDYIKAAAVASAKQATPGGIKQDTILMSSDSFQKAITNIENTRKAVENATGGNVTVKTAVLNNTVKITGTVVTPKPVPATPPAKVEPVKPTSQIACPPPTASTIKSSVSQGILSSVASTSAGVFNGMVTGAMNLVTAPIKMVEQYVDNPSKLIELTTPQQNIQAVKSTVQSYTNLAQSAINGDANAAGQLLFDAMLTIATAGEGAVLLSAEKAVIRSAVEGTGKGLETKGYKPQPGERTFEGYVNDNVPIDKETKLFTNSPGFNNVGTPGGQFKRFGSDSHADLAPHVHQPQRNVDPSGNVRGSVGSKTKNDGVTSPTRNDVSQLYDYLNNGKYKP